MWKRGKREWNIELSCVCARVCVCCKEQCHGNRSLWSRKQVGGTQLKLQAPCMCVRACNIHFVVLVECVEIMSGGTPAEHRNALFIIRHSHSGSLLTNEL